MKKLVALLLVLACCFGCTALADTPDFDNMTTADIYDLVSAGKAVLDYRASVTQDKTIISQDGITIGFGEPYYFNSNNKPYAFYNYLVVINESGYDLTIENHSVKMNGWTINDSGFFYKDYYAPEESHTFPNGIRNREESIYNNDVARTAGISSWDELETYTWHFSFTQKIDDTTTRMIELIVDCTFSPDTGLTIAKITQVQ